MLTPQDRCILQAKWLQWTRPWKQLTWNRCLQVSGFVLLLCVFWYLSYFLVSYLCGALYNIKVVGPLILQRILSFGFLAAFMVVTVGHLLTSFTSLYRGNKLREIIASPYPPHCLFRYQALENVFSGGWVSGVFCLPILWAYGQKLNAVWWYYPVVLTGLVALLAIAGILGTLIMLLIARFILGRPTRTAIAIGGVLVSFAALVFYISQIGQLFFSNVDMAHIGEALANLRLSSTPYLPNQWLSELMLAARYQDLLRVGLYLFCFFSTTLFLWAITQELGYRFYASAWLWAQERITLFRRRNNHTKLKKRVFWINHFFPRNIAAIVYKEVHLFLRDFSQWGQLVLILTLILFYVSHMRNIRLIQDNGMVRHQIAFFNIFLLGFLQATLALRYTFPSISMEGKASWALFSSSIGLRRFYLTKFFLHSLVLWFFGSSITWVLNSILWIDSALHYLCMFILLLLSFGLTACTLGLGAIFHNFEAKTSADVSSDTGALVTMIVTLLYFALTMYLAARFSLNYFTGQSFWQQFEFQPYLYIDSAIFLSLQYIAITVPTSFGLQKLQEVEM